MYARALIAFVATLLSAASAFATTPDEATELAARVVALETTVRAQSSAATFETRPEYRPLDDLEDERGESASAYVPLDALEDQPRDEPVAYSVPSRSTASIPASSVSTVPDERDEEAQFWTPGQQAGTIVAVLGVGAIGTSVVVSAQIAAAERELERSHALGEFASQADRIESLQRVGRTFLFGGAALLAVGGSLWLWDAIEVRPSLGATGIGASATF